MYQEKPREKPREASRATPRTMHPTIDTTIHQAAPTAAHQGAPTAARRAAPTAAHRAPHRAVSKALWWILLVSLPAAAQQPRIVNAKIESRSAAAGLDGVFRGLLSGQTGPAWIGYAAPMIAGDRNMCCWNNNACVGCGLEGPKTAAPSSAPTGPVRLEGPGSFVVLYRVEQRNVGKIRSFSADCELDAGGLTVYWLTGVRPAQSIALLSSFATLPDSGVKERDKMREPAVSTIALHAGPEADQALEQFVAPNQPESLRQRSAFWLGSARGRRGYEVLRRLVRDDPSDRVRDKALFALSVSPEPGALDAMIETAKGDKSTHVRGQALFWLAQRAGTKAAGAITDAIANDPETEVKKRAVFALSQLPKDDGVRLLIEVARTNRNPVVRKQAIFWLGQSRDPRALDYIEQILAH